MSDKEKAKVDIGTHPEEVINESDPSLAEYTTDEQVCSPEFGCKETDGDVEDPQN